MAFDGFVLHALTHELNESLLGGRITKIHQPEPTDLVLLIRAGGKNHKLLISGNLTFPRLYLTTEDFTNPQEPPMFTMLLRKHLEGGVIQSIDQLEMERILHIKVSSRDELGDYHVLTLIVEIMGRHSNIILVDQERDMILDSLHRVTLSISTYRQVLPGRPYTSPPAQDKREPLQLDREAFLSQLSFNEGRLDRQMVEKLMGLSPLLAKEIVHRAKLPTQENLWKAYEDFIDHIKQKKFQPTIVVEGTKSYFSCIDLTHIDGRTRHFPTMSECLQTYFQTRADRDLVRQQSQDLLRRLQQEKKKNEQKLVKLEETIADAEKADRYRLWGELITSYQFQLNKGESVAQLPNYYEEEQPLIEIPLDPLLSPNENAQRYFRRYNKAKNSIEVVEEQIELTKAEIEYLERIIYQVEQAEKDDLEEIREELVEEGYLRDRSKKNRGRKKEKAAKPYRYVSKEGYTILIGRNNKQNDQLTNRIARANDTWLHTKDIPSSHVVIQGESFGEETLYEAAMLVAYYSKARQSSSVPVDYTLIRHVRKPNGAKPGYVIYENQKTLYVTPDEEWVQSLNLRTD